MTPNQIKRRLMAAGFDMKSIQDIDRDEVTIAVMDGDTGRADEEKTEVAKAAFREIFPWGGFKCGWGGWILQSNHRIDPHAGTKAGREHY